MSTSSRSKRARVDTGPFASASAQAKELLKQYTRKASPVPAEDCLICLESCQNPSGFGQSTNDVSTLLSCNHSFHSQCLVSFLQSAADQVLYNTTCSYYMELVMYEFLNQASLSCPNCKTVHGVKTGNQPRNGTMKVNVIKKSLPGFSRTSTFVITYNFTHGIQGPEHPNPGKPYSANFPRTAYLPKNTEGKKVLKLLKIAFKRRLLFTLGRSVTTGQDNTVTWNDIHHKTEFGPSHNGFGYPDATYLDRVLEELKAQGVE